MPFIQQSFLFGERNTNDVGSREYNNSVKELTNFRVLKNGSIKRRPSTTLVKKFEQIDFNEVKKVFPLKQAYVFLMKDGIIKIAVNNIIKNISLISNTLNVYDESSSETPVARFVASYKSEFNLLKANDIFLLAGQLWVLVNNELPFIIEYIEEQIEVRPYFLTRTNVGDFQELVRAYPIKENSEEVVGLFFNGEIEEDITPELIIGSDNDLDNQTCKAWLGVKETDRSTITDINTSKMGLQEYLNKPLYFNIYPTTTPLIPEAPSTDKTFWDKASSYPDGVLKNLNTAAGLTNFSYSSPNLIEDDKTASKTTVIKNLLYGRRYMIIPKKIINNGSFSGKNSYSTVFPEPDLITTDKTSLRFTPENLDVRLEDNQIDVDTLKVVPAGLNKKISESAPLSSMEFKDIPLIGVDFDSDDVDFRYGFVTDGERLRTNAGDFPFNQPDYLTDNNIQPGKGVFINNKFVEVRKAELRLEIGEDGIEDFEIRIFFANPVFQGVDTDDLLSSIDVQVEEQSIDIRSVLYNPETNFLSIEGTDKQTTALNGWGNSVTNNTSLLSFISYFTGIRRIERSGLSFSERREDREILEETILDLLKTSDEANLNLGVKISFSGLSFIPNILDETELYGVFNGDPENEVYKNAGSATVEKAGESFDFFENLRIGSGLKAGEQNLSWFKGISVRNNQYIDIITEGISEIQTFLGFSLVINKKDGSSTTFDSIAYEGTEPYYLNNVYWSILTDPTLLLYDMIKNDLIQSLDFTFKNAIGGQTVKLPVTLPANLVSEEVLAKGFSLFLNTRYTHGGQGADETRILDQEGEINEEDTPKDVTAFGWYKTDSDKYVWFLKAKKTENPLENASSISIEVNSGAAVVLTKTDTVLLNEVEFISDELNDEPTLSDETTLQITINQKDYVFSVGRSKHKQSKVYAECEIYEIGMPSPAKKDSIRVIGGNDYDPDTNSFTNQFFSSVDLNFNKVSRIDDDIFLSNINTVCRVYKDFKANEPQLFLGSPALDEGTKQIFRQTAFIAGAFTRVSPRVIQDYFTKGGDNLSYLLSSSQAQSISEFLDDQIGSAGSGVQIYSIKLNSIFSKSLKIIDIKPHFSLTEVYATTTEGIYLLRWSGSERQLGLVSEQISQFQPIVFTNKIVYFNNNNLLVSQIYSQERLGNVESYSGSAQEHLLNGIIDMVYDKSKNLFLFLRNNGEITHATDFDTAVEGWGKWRFSEIQGTEIKFKPLKIFLEGNDLFIYASYPQWNDITKDFDHISGIFKLDYSNSEDYEGVNIGLDAEPQTFISRVQSNSYLGDQSGGVSLLEKIRFTNLWLNAYGVEIKNGIIPQIMTGFTNSNLEERLLEYTRINENTQKIILTPLDFRKGLGYNNSIIIQTADLNPDFVLNGFVLGGEISG